MNQQAYQIQVSGLWKVFGNRPERALQPQHASKSRDEIQDELGLVVGLRDLSFNVPMGQTFVVMGAFGQRQVDPGALSDQADRRHRRTDLFRRRRYCHLFA